MIDHHQAAVSDTSLLKRTASPAIDRRRMIKPVLLFTIAAVLAFAFGFPLYFMITTGFKAEPEVLATPIHWLPQSFQGLSNYARAFELAPVGRWFFNSTLMAVLDVAFTVFFSALAGYGFAKFHFRGQRILFLFVLSTLMVPFPILVIPLYVEMRAFGWVDSYAGLIIPGLLNAFGVFMMRQFAFSIPDELLDAARIDGASEVRIFGRIVFPLLAPASASLAIIIFLWSWNNFLWPLVIIQNQDYITLPVGMTVFTLPMRSQPAWAIAMAVSTLATLPVLVLFIFFQRYFIQGMVMSGLKG